MKRIASLLLTLLLLLNLVGCNPPDASDISGDAGVSQTTTTTTENAGQPDTDGTTTQNNKTDTVGDQNSGGQTTTGTQQNGNEQPDTTTQTRKPVTTTTTTTTTKKPTTTTTATPSAELQLVDKAFALTGSATLQATLTGTVISVKEAYNSNYGNATFTIRVQGTNGTKELYCYRCKPAGQTEVAVGHKVTLTGTIKNYKGTIEFDQASYTVVGGTTTTTKPLSAGDIDVNGIYDSKEEVALYIHTYGKLPKNYVNKNQYENLGRPKDKCVGGNRFYNNEGLLPSGYTYYECDIDTYGKSSRGAKRIVYTTSGIVYYTSDHYESFTQLYGAR